MGIQINSQLKQSAKFWTFCGYLEVPVEVPAGGLIAEHYACKDRYLILLICVYNANKERSHLETKDTCFCRPGIPDLVPCPPCSGTYFNPNDLADVYTMLPDNNYLPASSLFNTTRRPRLYCMSLVLVAKAVP